jgi:sulfur-oxidizing protein SoxY
MMTAMTTMPSANPQTASRREVLAAAAGLVSLALVPSARATPDAMEAAIRAFVGEAPVKPGPVTLDVPALVENGNAVPLTVSVDSPMTAESFVKAIAVFNEKNPQPNVAIFHLGPRCGRATVSTRIRLADSQKLIAVAQLSDGSFVSTGADVLVTLAACVETG